MNAKEERAHNLEIHKMTRSNNELAIKNSALEIECMRLRLAIKQESEKHAANHAALMRQVNATMELEREKINALQRNFEKERERLTDDAYKDAVAQRASHMDALGDIKRHLDIRYNEKLNENKIALDAAIRQLDEERERIKHDEREQLAQLNEEREQIKRQLNEGRERIKRDEKEQLVQFLFHMDLEREKNQCQLEKERALMMEQVHRETLAQRQSNADLLAEMKISLDAKHNAKMNELEVAMQESNEEREQLQQTVQDQLAQLNEEREQLQQNEEERRIQLQDQLTQLNEEREQLQQNEEERRIQLNEDREQIKLDEKEQRDQFLIYMDSERENAQCQMEKERELMMERAHAQRQFNEDALAEMKMQLETNSNAQLTAQLNENTLAFDAAMRQLNEERDQLKQQLDEECKRNMRDDLEREKMHALQLQLENERKRVAEQAQIDAASQRQSNADMLAESKRHLDAQFNEQMNKNKIAFDAAIQKMNEEHARIKQDDLEREKMKCQLENERKRVAEQAQIDAAAQRQSNADMLAESKRHLDAQFNEQMNKNKIAFDATMQQLNEERVQIKRILTEERERNKQDDLEREKTNAFQRRLEKEREYLFERAQKDAVTQRQANVDAIAETKRQLDLQFNAQMNKNKLALDAATQKLNEERDQLKQHEQNLNDLFRKKMQTLEDDLEKEREALAEQARKDDVAQKQCNADALKELKKQFDAQCIASMNKNKIALDAAATQKLNEDREPPAHELNRRLKLDNSEVAHMNDAIDSNYAHMQLIHTLNFTNKRVMLYSHYSDKNEVESYNLLTIECVQHYFDYIIILTNCPNKWNMHSPNYNKCHLLAYNMKSDFRNYGVFIMQTAKTLANASRLCLINDSFVIVDVSVFGYCIKTLFNRDNMSHDFIGLTSSHEGIFHLQSYFMCFNSTTVPAIMSYFETHGLPMNHQSAISQYELGITSYLIDKGFSSFAVVSNNDMRHPLNTTCCKWSAVLQDIGIIKRQHFFKRYAYAAMTDANIALVAEKYSYNKHLMHFLKYNGIHIQTNME